MFRATFTSTALRVARGMNLARGAAASRMTSRVSACTMPATGVRAPHLMLVAVRAMAEVAAMPPNRGETMLARPWAISSWLESWRSSVMPSATTAHSSDSMAARSAMVVAGRIRCWILAQLRSGHWKVGRPWGMPPNLLPMVSTGRWNRITARVPSSRATMDPGTRRCHDFGQARMMVSETTARMSELGWKVPRWVNSTSIFSTNSEGTLSTRRPRKSLIWVLKISTAMPEVKPIVTG